MERKFKIGQKIGRLTILEYLHTDHSSKRIVRCMCDCGKIHETRSNNIGRKTNSCGCYKAESIKKRMGKPIDLLASRSVLNSCKRYNSDTDLDQEIVHSLIFNNCFYCEKSPSEVGSIFTRAIKDGRSIKRIGIDRIDSSRGYYKDNVVSCCTMCNYLKRNHSPKDLLARLEVFIKNLRSLTS
jgi:hypothetical protein